MTRKLLHTLIITSTLVYTGWAAASTNPDPKTDLLTVYKLALEHDAQLASEKATMQATVEGQYQSRAALLPSITLDASTNDNKDVNLYHAPIAGHHRTDDYNTHNWQATLSQPVFNLAAWFAYDLSQFTSEKAKTTFAKQQQDLILQVADAYFAVLQAEDQLTTRKSEERAYKRQYDQAEQRYEVGLVARTDVYEAKSAYDTARVNRIVSANAVQVSYQELWTLTGERITRLDQFNKEMPVTEPLPNNQKNWVESAMLHNLAIHEAEYDVKRGKADIKVQKSGHAPTINAVVSYGHGVNYAAGNAPYSEKNNSTVMGLQFSLPLFSGGAVNSKVRQAEYTLEQARQSLEFTKRSTSQNARSLFMTVNSDVARIDAARLGIISSKSSLDATQSGYKVGTRNVIDVLNAQQVLFNSVESYLNARYEFLINTLKLKQAAGTLAPQDLIDLNQWVTAEKTSLLPNLKEMLPKQKKSINKAYIK